MRQKRRKNVNELENASKQESLEKGYGRDTIFKRPENLEKRKQKEITKEGEKMTEKEKKLNKQQSTRPNKGSEHFSSLLMLARSPNGTFPSRFVVYDFEHLNPAWSSQFRGAADVIDLKNIFMTSHLAVRKILNNF